MTDTKSCPFCGETIKIVAKKCRYCGEFFDGYTRERLWREISTGGGAAIGNNVNTTGGDFIGRDKISFGKERRDEQYEIVLHWDGDTKLREFDLIRRDLSWLNLASADLRNSQLDETNLEGTNLRDSKLTGASLRGAILSGTNLERADLRRTNLEFAKLTGTRLYGANLQGANLCSTELIGVVLPKVVYTRSTQWPKGFDPESVGAIEVEFDEHYILPDW